MTSFSSIIFIDLIKCITEHVPMPLRICHQKFKTTSISGWSYETCFRGDVRQFLAAVQCFDGEYCSVYQV